MIGAHRTDRCEIMRQMQRRQSDQLLQSNHHGVINQDRSSVVRPGVSDAMSHGQWLDPQFVPKPCVDDRECRRDITDIVIAVNAMRQRLSVHSVRLKARTAAQSPKPSLDFPFQPPLALHGKKLEAHPRHIGIDSED